MWLISNKVMVAESGLLEGFRDCHCHLLPAVDDGVQDQKMTMQILEEWAHLGVREVWMTPHIMEDYPNDPDDLKRRFEQVKADYKGPIALRLAAEHMMDGPFVDRLSEGRVMPIGAGGGRLLVETSYYTPPMNMEAVVDRVRAMGYVPILAHPERYQYMEKRDYKAWKERGAKLQLNVPSLVGAYGPDVMAKAEWMLKEDMYDYCGSDTHSMNQVDMFLGSMISKKTVKKVRTIAENMDL